MRIVSLHLRCLARFWIRFWMLKSFFFAYILLLHTRAPWFKRRKERGEHQTFSSSPILHCSSKAYLKSCQSIFDGEFRQNNKQRKLLWGKYKNTFFIKLLFSSTSTLYLQLMSSRMIITSFLEENYFHLKLGRNGMTFFIKNFFFECDRIRKELQIWSHILKKFLMENFFCAVLWSCFICIDALRKVFKIGAFKNLWTI